MTDFFSGRGSRDGGQCNCPCAQLDGITAEEVRLFLASGGDVAVMEMKARLKKRRKRKRKKQRGGRSNGFFDEVEGEDEEDDDEDDSEPITFLMEDEAEDEDDEEEKGDKKQKKRRKKKKRGKKKTLRKSSMEDEIDNENEEEENTTAATTTTEKMPTSSEMLELLKKMRGEMSTQKPRGGKQLFGFEEELIEEVVKLSDEQIDTLPDDQKAAILELRQLIQEAEALQSHVVEEDAEVFDEAETIHFGSNPRPSQEFKSSPSSFKKPTSPNKKPSKKPEKHAGVGDTAEDLDDMVHAGQGDHLRKVFVRYLVRLRTIYELDIQLIDQLGDLLAAFDDEILPVLETNLNLLRPLTNLVLQSSGGNINLVELISFIVKSLSNSEYEIGFGASLKDLEFLNFRK